jgi:hypothetical protein
MVKNTNGGSKHKSSARKHAATTATAYRDPTPSSPFEKIATVDRLLGNGMCIVLTHEPKPLSLLCHIRGKFRGKQKSHNIVSNKSIVLIGLRDWESIPKNCDLLAILRGNQGFPLTPILNDEDELVFSDNNLTDDHDSNYTINHNLQLQQPPDDQDIDFNDI